MRDQAGAPVAPPALAALDEPAQGSSRFLSDSLPPQANCRVSDAQEPRDGLLAVAPLMRELVEQARLVARSKVAVLIEGESGTGKELLARLIHDASPRAAQPFVQVNCAAFSETLIESELFGHEKGAFTGAESARPGRFELAHGSTMLLDEIGEMPLRLQAKLLRVLEEERFERLGGTRALQVDVRVLATTNRDLQAEVARGQFRGDLYYRLNGVRFVVPPLRHRREEIPRLAEHFFQRFRGESRVPLRGLSARALELLTTHSWPGNVRQLRNVIHRACLLARGVEIQPADLPPTEEGTAQPGTLEGMTLAEIERRVILTTLRSLNGNKTAAAARLGVTPRTLLNKLKKYRAEGQVS